MTAKLKDFKVLPIKNKETYSWLLEKHYAKRIPSIKYSFGLFNENKNLVGIITYGIPASRSLVIGICGKKYAEYVYELNRLCLQDNKKNEASFLISKSMKMLPKPSIVVSYADSSANHNGYVYQATNFIYTGLSDKRTEWREKNTNKHSKTICEQYSLRERQNNPEKFYVMERPRKHRYIYFNGDKKEKKILHNSLKYEIQPYPKGQNKKYDSGEQVNTQQILF